MKTSEAARGLDPRVAFVFIHNYRETTSFRTWTTIKLDKFPPGYPAASGGPVRRSLLIRGYVVTTPGRQDGAGQSSVCGYICPIFLPNVKDLIASCRACVCAAGVFGGGGRARVSVIAVLSGRGSGSYTGSSLRCRRSCLA